MHRFSSALLIITIALGVTRPVGAQEYFGQNRVRYRTMDFKVLRTEHFDIYYYEDEAKAVDMVGRMAER